MNLMIAEKNVLITGSGRNIGRSIALEMAEKGANIYFTDFDENLSKNLEGELSLYPEKIMDLYLISPISMILIFYAEHSERIKLI